MPLKKARQKYKISNCFKTSNKYSCYPGISCLHHQQDSDQNISESNMNYYVPLGAHTNHNRVLGFNLFPSLILLNTGKHFSKTFKGPDQMPPAIFPSSLKYILVRILYLLVHLFGKPLCKLRDDK